MLKQGRSVMLVAPTGLEKTFAVTGDLQDQFCKTVYSVPLRALGSGIRKAIHDLKRNGQALSPVIHHGDLQESELFSEEVIVTTYDQVVCGAAGLPLSLPLKAGHAVAGALLMSRLILDEVHLAWGISDRALSILLAIIDFRRNLGLQTIVITATLPDLVARLISERVNLDLKIVGKDDLADDEGLKLRENNRQVTISTLPLKAKGKGESKELDYSPLDEKLISSASKRIYFANTVDRLQETYDRLIAARFCKDKITVLHNRMPRSWRSNVEKQVDERFGKDSPDGDWLLLTNQVAEAGLDISAPLVISDPASVDTLIQRAGRCARWFRSGVIQGKFLVIEATKELARPYRPDLVHRALATIPQDRLSWAEEMEWINKAWGITPKKGISPQAAGEKQKEQQKEQIERSLDETTFALNLFDRAAQERKPGEIANVFREILSIEVAVTEGELVSQIIDDNAQDDLQSLLLQGKHPETSSISLGRGYELIQRGETAVVDFEDGVLVLRRLGPDEYIRPGDTLIVPSTMAYLHRVKGLCFGDGSLVDDAILSSEWLDRKKSKSRGPSQGRRQSLLQHTSGVMDRTYSRLKERGSYRDALIKILKSLEPQSNADQLMDVIAEFARVAAAFHDLGKADQRWQDRAREIDPHCSAELIGRTANIRERMNIPHTPPIYPTIIKASELLVGSLGSAKYLIRAIALAAARHHSSLVNPATVKHLFRPHTDTGQFVRDLLVLLKAPQSLLEKSQDIIHAGSIAVKQDEIPLMLPNDDLFPIYALVGRAILLADREDARGEDIEQWR
jgi:CRISPR-associated endonuclease/helicase Cas3